MLALINDGFAMRTVKSFLSPMTVFLAGVGLLLCNVGCDQVAVAPETPSEQQNEQLSPQIVPNFRLGQTPKLEGQAGEATTATELIADLKKNPYRPYVQPRLSEAELGKVVKQLRSQFPLVSIRDRLQFQDGEPAQSNFTISGPFAISGRHSVALASLHSDRVDSFISESGQGIFRITPVGPQDLFLPSGGLATKAKAQPVGSEIRFEAIVKLDETIKMQESRFRIRMGEMDPDDNFTNSLSADGLPKQQKLSIFNEWAVDSFASQAGYVKSIDEVAGFEAHRVRFGEHWSGNLRDSKEVLEQQDIDVEDSGIAWKANRLELVSLLMHDEPLVYDVDELPNMETLSSETAKTRALDEFETKALEALKSGEELFVRATKNRILMVGSIRASEQCLSCHSVKKGDLLGAFSYEFLRNPPFHPDVSLVK